MSSHPPLHTVLSRRHTALLLALLGVLALPARPTRAAAPGNLLPNGSFETDADGNGIPDGWEDVQAPTPGQCLRDTKIHHGGTASLHIVHAAANSDWVRASVNHILARPGHLVALSGWVRATGPWRVILYEFPRSERKPYLTHEIASGRKTGWAHVAGAVRTASDAKDFKVSLITDGKGEAWFDDFALTDLETPPQLAIPRLPAAPKIDGNPNDAAWTAAATLGPFWKLDGNGAAAAVPTTVRVGFHRDTLFIAWTCAEPRIEDISRPKPHAAPPSWNDETVELFLMPDPNLGGYWHLGTTPGGGRLSEFKSVAGAAYYADWYSPRPTARTGPRSTALPDWKTAARRGKKQWTAEMAVPLAGVPSALIPGTLWRIQFARSRKITGTEQNSCWAYTPGNSFHAPEHFGRAAPPLWNRYHPKILPARTAWIPAETRVVPAPQHLIRLQRSPRELRSRGAVVAVRTPQSPDAAAKALRRLLARFDIPVQFRNLDAPAPDFLLDNRPPAAPRRTARALARLQHLLPPHMPPWQAAEAYILDTAGRTAYLIAPGARGRLYAVQTLRQLLQTRGDRVRIPAVRIADWPQMQWRGWHLIAPETSADVAAAKRIIDVLAALKMNWVALQIDNRLRYTRDPRLGRPGAPSKAELRSIAAYAEDRLMEVIPMTQCWSHFSYFLSKPAFRNLCEQPHPAANARVKYWNYCPRNPASHKMLFGMIEEQLECFPHARYFHCGLDEIRFGAIGVCPRCKGTPGGVLMAEEVNRLHAFLKKKHLTMCMWGDQLLPEHNGGPPYNTAKAIDHIPKDILIFDWHYNPATAYPSVEYFMNHGFRVVACGWYEPLNVVNFSNTAFRRGALGYGGTTWYNIGRIRDEIRLITAMPLTAENTWSPGHPAIDRLGYRPAAVFQRLWRRTPPPPPRRFALIDLQRWANRTLADDDRRLGALGLGAANDLAALPTGIQWFAGAPFRIPSPNRRQCLVLAKAGDPPGASWPESAWPIPLDVRARALLFLQTCTHPKQFTRHIYDRRGINPTAIVQCTITYADGSSAQMTCRWNRRISDWNSQLGSAWGQTAWRGKTRSGALARIEAVQWLNPHPEKTLATLAVTSLDSTVRPILIAVTAVQ